MQPFINSFGYNSQENGILSKVMAGINEGNIKHEAEKSVCGLINFIILHQIYFL
jgi:hypothetical protein